MYEKILKPVMPTPEAVETGAPLGPEVLSQIRYFWMIFAVLGIFCLLGMLLFNKFLSQDTPESNRRAWMIMLGVYFILAGAGVFFFIKSLFLVPEVQWKTFVQSLILLLLGSGGILISIGKK
jgi:hypothetical protein